MAVLKGKKSGDPTVPAQSILAERRVRCIPPVCGGPGTVRGRRIPCCTKVELFGAHARQGKETVHLVGNRESWWDDREGTDVTGGPDCCRRPRLIQLGATITVVSTKIIKCLMGSADDLSSLLACTHYLHAGITSMGSSAT